MHTRVKNIAIYLFVTKSHNYGGILLSFDASDDDDDIDDGDDNDINDKFTSIDR